MTSQADRIEALMLENKALLTDVNAKLDLWLAGQKRTKKPSLTPEERDAIHSDYASKFKGDITEMDFQIELALQHTAAKKNSNMNLYVRNWLNQEMKRGKSPDKKQDDGNKYLREYEKRRG